MVGGRSALALGYEPEKHVASGYTTVDGADQEAGFYWICERCFVDFADELAWTSVTSDPEASPYETQEPTG